MGEKKSWNEGRGGEAEAQGHLY